MCSKRFSTLGFGAGLGTLLSVSCAEESKGPVLLVSAERSYLNGEVVVDGEPWGTLGEYGFNTGVLGTAMRAASPSSELRDLVGVNLDLSGMANGVHRVAVRKEGVPGLETSFELPFRGGDSACIVSLLANYQGAAAACEVRRHAS